MGLAPPPPRQAPPPDLVTSQSPGVIVLQISDTAAIVFEQQLKSSAAASQDATPALIRKVQDGAPHPDPANTTPPPHRVPMVLDWLVTLHAGRVGSQQLSSR